MKVVKHDNYNRESISDELICENCNPYWGKLITDLLNERCSGEQSPDFFRCVEDNHVLYVYNPT